MTPLLWMAGLGVPAAAVAWVLAVARRRPVPVRVEATRPGPGTRVPGGRL
ncbi:MAG TPA: hypothetical protein VFN68_07655 [Acidimicrobiales bacterium]|nr:hypothetical protein [Acidimicrobiales bacterium]